MPVKKEWLSAPIWSTALVASLLIGTITTTIATAFYLADRFGAVETRIATLEAKFEAAKEIAEIRYQNHQLFAKDAP